MNQSVAIKIEGLTKIYSGRKEPAVDDLSLEIFQGDFFGLLGPNGAGKTTTISTLCSLLHPSSGTIKIAGLDLHSNLLKIKHLIGVVSQDIALYDTLTAYENLFYFGSLFNIQKKVLNKRIDYLLDRLGLEGVKNEKIASFSGGMQRRINLMAGMLHSPEILFLDEPTVGVDVHSRNVIREFLMEINKETTIVYTSHIIDDAERLCNRVAIIDYGQLKVIGSPTDFLNENTDCQSLEDYFLKVTGKKLRD